MMKSLKLNTLTRPTSFIILQMFYARSISFIYMTLNIAFGTTQNSYLTWPEVLNKTETMEKVTAKFFSQAQPQFHQEISAKDPFKPRRQR